MTDSAGASFTVVRAPASSAPSIYPSPAGDVVRMLWTGLIRDPGADRRGRWPRAAPAGHPSSRGFAALCPWRLDGWFRCGHAGRRHRGCRDRLPCDGWRGGSPAATAAGSDGPVRVTPGWLALREPADAAARPGEFAETIARRLAERQIRAGAQELTIHDLGAGTGRCCDGWRPCSQVRSAGCCTIATPSSRGTPIATGCGPQGTSRCGSSTASTTSHGSPRPTWPVRT